MTFEACLLLLLLACCCQQPSQAITEMDLLSPCPTEATQDSYWTPNSSLGLDGTKGFKQCSTPSILSEYPMMPGRGSGAKLGIAGASADGVDEMRLLSREEYNNRIRQLSEAYFGMARQPGYSFLQERGDEPRFSCRAANGSPVAWFIALKQRASFGYVYITDMSHHRWIDMTQGDILNGGPVFETVKQLNGMAQDSKVMVYSSMNSNADEGHQNGEIVFGSDQGFWMMHSWRRMFEYFVKNQPPPEASRSKGQSFVCLTLSDAQDLPLILQQLSVTNPHIHYKQNIYLPGPANGQEMMAGFRTGNDTFFHFAKPRPGEIYDWVASFCKSSLLVQSWSHPRVNSLGWVNLPDGLHVTDINETQLLNMPAMNRSSQADHSKWCITHRQSARLNENDFVVCIGDLNRPCSNRRGGALCVYHKSVWQLFQDGAKKYINENGIITGLQ